MLITTVISLHKSKKQKRYKKISFWIKIILCIPTESERLIPVYLIIIHGIIQTISIFCIICLYNNVVSRKLCQEIYGGCMIVLIVPLTILCKSCSINGRGY